MARLWCANCIAYVEYELKEDIEEFFAIGQVTPIETVTMTHYNCLTCRAYLKPPSKPELEEGGVFFNE